MFTAVTAKVAPSPYSLFEAREGKRHGLDRWSSVYLRHWMMMGDDDGAMGLLSAQQPVIDRRKVRRETPTLRQSFAARILERFQERPECRKSQADRPKTRAERDLA
ncbi:hypothetical protein N1937_04130 [Rhizobium sp. WSM4643]|uniref:hypothetical protein n=1 Tax=unclassified Rhizobium TaxID=2613769 RepID=UPI0021A76AED|nr:hypothetical protein [Rhizobium leguminosarum]MBW8787084.1 hypothetical protein [Rhizobium leguminosarum]UWM76443.1 hypothetical protein N1937_04130 [Rhizobium leguminosarum bv. viciae]